jgi:hypothetical protein
MSRTDVGGLLAIVVFYLASRRLLHLAGVEFDSVGVQIYWQILPYHLLRDELWTSLWYLHSQPPLFNLLLGLAFQVSEWRTQSCDWASRPSLSGPWPSSSCGFG